MMKINWPSNISAFDSKKILTDASKFGLHIESVNPFFENTIYEVETNQGKYLWSQSFILSWSEISRTICETQDEIGTQYRLDEGSSFTIWEAYHWHSYEGAIGREPHLFSYIEY